MNPHSPAPASRIPSPPPVPEILVPPVNEDVGYEAALPYLNSQPGDLDLLFSPQHEDPPHE